MTPKAKPCSCCGASAAFSLSLLISSLSVTPRQQKCSLSVPLCADCVEELCTVDVAQITEELRNALKNAYTAIKVAVSECAQHRDTSKS